MTRAVVLARVSTEEQADNHSLPAQLRAVREFCAARDYQIVEEVEAPGESASTHDLARRPSIQRIVELAAQRAVDVVVYHESSRLTRNVEFAAYLLRTLTSYGVRLVNSSQDLDYGTPEGEAMFGVSSVFDRYYAAKMAAHIRKGKRERFESGLTNGMLPFGYGRTGERVVPIDDEADAVREAFAMRLRGEGYTAIGGMLSALGHRPRSRRGYPAFTISTVQSMIENSFYAGFVTHRGDRRRGQHEAIVTEATWAAAQAVASRHYHQRRTNGALLAGLAECAVCGGPIWSGVTGSPSRPMYREPANLQFRECANARTMWQAAIPDGQVADALRSMSLDRAWLASLERDLRRPGERRRPVDRDALMGQRERATEAYVAGALPWARWQEIVTGIDRELSEAPRVEEIRAARSIAGWAEVWDAALPAERADAVRIVLSRVSLDTRAKEVRVQPKPEYAPLFEARRAHLCVEIPPPGAGGNPTHGPLWFRPAELVA